MLARKTLLFQIKTTVARVCNTHTWHASNPLWRVCKATLVLCGKTLAARSCVGEGMCALHCDRHARFTCTWVTHAAALAGALPYTSMAVPERSCFRAMRRGQDTLRYTGSAGTWKTGMCL